MHLIYLSPVHWESFAQRPHKFVDWFHRRTGGDVLWLQPYPTRLPNMEDLARRGAVVDRVIGGAPPEWLTVVQPGGLPLEPVPGSQLINRRYWREAVDRAEQFSHNRRCLIAVGKPSKLALMLLERVKHVDSLYDAMDDFPSFYRGLSKLSMKRNEQAVAHKARRMWISSTELLQRWSPERGDVQLVRNGLDPAAVPALVDYEPRDGKVFGYLGTIARWFDWDWLRKLAEVRPADEIRLIGPVFNPPDGTLPKNVTMHPACDHVTGIRRMMQFDVGLIPFRQTELTASVDPIKFYEYRALGIPVVSTDFGEMRFRAQDTGVFVTRDFADIAAMADRAIAAGRTNAKDAGFLMRNAWDTRFDETGLLTSAA